ncbi:MAG TPA: ribosomal protein S18-alanine N-acetyltransferase [Symbiobacteriaceae bacterium]|jgi:ribosomal-protein-alanine N-acetyltransferase|nr:ribosomal protein S18-alanine N-acetyltransferase [Symbiobacteriaceae bacterium]
MGSPEIAIFPMTPGDLDGVMEVERRSFLTPWSREAFLGELMQTYTVYLVAKEGSKVVAHGGMHVVWEDSHVTNIAVLPEYRGRGLGEHMMLELISRAVHRGASRMTLEVRATNTPAQNLYRKLGFVTEKGAVRKGYYEDTGEDAIVMWKDPL